MLIGLNLFSQPAQAISVNFSFANRSGTIPPIGADQFVTGTIDGLVEGNNSGVGVTATVLSTPTGEYVGGGYAFANTIAGGNAFIVTNGNITFANASLNNGVLLSFLSAGVDGINTNGFAELFDYNANPSGYFGDNQSATFTATAVPWGTDALSVVGTTLLFGLGVLAKGKFAKPLQK